jgi:hypothetical protein
MGPTIHEKGRDIELVKKDKKKKNSKKKNEQIISLFSLSLFFSNLCTPFFFPPFIAFPVLLFHCDIPSGWAGKHIPHHSKKKKKYT